MSQSNMTPKTNKNGFINHDQASKRRLLCVKEAPGGSETYTSTQYIGLEELSKNFGILRPLDPRVISIFMRGGALNAPSVSCRVNGLQSKNII